ncbi:hypothetical protein Vadar_028666 [Vaccinium darrowii]|uniref:Uncharacterized protein n=1 Tax=Vaccinium darrowii TaxID=229202 RepID=A0ACB7XVD6_9ERIC|nr:hypothetical protein Vadar_028666 [Vaccinium darrowii]
MSVHCAPSSLSIQSSETVQDLQQTSARRSANYKPSAWNSDFFKSLKTNDIVVHVFQRFKDKSGNFMESLCKDTKGLLSLYEASYLSFEGENLMEEAKVFTTKHLKGIKGKIVDRDLVEQINHALEMPLHHRMLRLGARWYIEAYGKRKDANHLLLEMAKLDFNMVQSLYQGELKDMSRWWEDLGLGKNLTFARDILMECFFWNVGIVFEPKFRDCRKSLTKLVALTTIIDDVYDVYGYLDELQLFTTAVARWDVKAVDTLRDYMKLCFLALYNTTNEMAYDILRQKGVNIIPYLTGATEKIVGFANGAVVLDMEETKVLPTVASAKGTPFATSRHLPTSTPENPVELLLKDLRLCLYNFFGPCKAQLTASTGSPTPVFYKRRTRVSFAELERGESANSIVCYMHETGVFEQEARKYIYILIEEAWKKMNEERVAADSPFEKSFIETAANLARICQCTYENVDGHGALDNQAKNLILSVIIEPITLVQRE